MKVERILIKKSHPAYKQVTNACERARKVRNYANYLIRQSFFDKERAVMQHFEADKHIKTAQRDIYTLLPSAAAQRTIQVLGKDWKSFFQSSKRYAESREGYRARPRPPKYKKGLATFCVGKNGFSIKDGYLIICRSSKQISIPAIKTTVCKNQKSNEEATRTIVQDVRFVPIGSAFYIEIVYVDTPQKQQTYDLDKNKHLSIDLGINNFATIISNQHDVRPVLINGKIIKSINAKYNKDCAKLRSKGKGSHIKHKAVKRYARMENYMHHVSSYVIDMAIRTKSKTIVVGKNVGWKQQINIGKVNNQKFVSIPFTTFLKKLQYKAKNVGITTIEREESYTSKASAIDLDVLPKTKTGQKYKFSGRRVKRGLYKTKETKYINADVNGALNILRKEIGDDFMEGIIDKGVVNMPKRVNPLVLEGSPRTSETHSIAISA